MRSRSLQVYHAELPPLAFNDGDDLEFVGLGMTLVKLDLNLGNQGNFSQIIQLYS
jgi:hypothetical protein